MKTKVIVHKQETIVHTDNMNNCYGNLYAVILSDKNLTRQTVLDTAGLPDATIEVTATYSVPIDETHTPNYYK